MTIFACVLCKANKIFCIPYRTLESSNMKIKNTAIERRIKKDIQNLHKSGHVRETQADGTLVCTLVGPADTPYEGQTYRLLISLPLEYPFKSPSVGFAENVFHPNVDYQSGSICLNVLNQEWTPVYNLVSIVETLVPQLLTYPNPDDPLNEEAAKLLVDDYETYKERCKY